METVFDQLKKDGFFPESFTLIKALQLVSYKKHPIEQVLLCESEDLKFALTLYLSINPLFRESSEIKEWERLLNTKYDSLLQLSKRIIQKKNKPSYRKVIDLIKKELPSMEDMSEGEIILFMYATNSCVSDILFEKKFSKTLKEAATLFLEKVESKDKDNSEIWEEFLNFEVEYKRTQKWTICSHKEIILVNEVGPKLPSGSSEILFKIKCHDCGETLFSTSEHKRNIINISKH